MQIRTYDEFIERVQSIGMMCLPGRFVEGFPSLVLETEREQWHTDDALTDPWMWKDRAPQEKKLAFGCILGGYKGFIARELYPYFYAACRPEEGIEERYFEGVVSQTTKQLYELLDTHRSLTTSQIRKHLGVTKKDGASRVDTAIKELQKSFYITVSNSEQKKNAKGEPYGWHINRYAFVEDWAPVGWLDEAEELTREEAREYILDTAEEISQGLDRVRLEKVLFGGL